MNNENNTRSFAVNVKKLLLGVTGGVAAYKVAELARLLTQKGVVVQTVMTKSACRFVGPATFQSLTGLPVFTELWEANVASNMAHINLSRNVEMILIAPASADFIAKLACGLADDLLSTLCLARNCPMMIAPAMNRQMWENPATQRNINRLQDDGVIVAGPADGEQACGEVGPGRMLETDALLMALQEMQTEILSASQLQGKNVLITAGPTYEAIDAVRGITNISSGKMGYAIAQAALEAGARVTLVSGPTCLKAPAVSRLVNVLSAQEMLNAVNEEVTRMHTDIFISVAAVADYRAVTVSQNKIKKSDQKLILELVPNTDILSHIANLSKPPFCVGFAAETDDLEKNAVLKRRYKKLPLVVANLAQETMGADEATLILFDEAGKHCLRKASKLVQARQLIKHIALLYTQQLNN
ncbi:Phosphopantothenate-cysteine ligase /Phosphopantothenoylcysteine decarboxylase [Nitrosomonas aestuarii]|uniref:Coenzyme A biosynthesis bifunctional protein CoaBC n=1 Tax=Nitrosomonas aestuarii TaxID=52441 RepID=A0A1I4E4Z5_9PROT|nr:bifunctional phosphopantothenoylcysteine decarboxylase/phosphopantothenate--cysteine ligase CoaBC [Nitrosomonas aestuarii]SFL00898.1 Phosphopantothenate-cysteine ligase /Phosphopantothenoylcysteine decarboxylase [Nitrosomonas aestuarii]